MQNGKADAAIIEAALVVGESDIWNMVLEGTNYAYNIYIYTVLLCIIV